MHLSVIIGVVFLSTLSTLSTRHLKRRFRHGMKLASRSHPSLHHFHRRNLMNGTEKLKDSDNKEQSIHDVENPSSFYDKMWKTIKTLPSSSQIRIKNRLIQVVTEEQAFVAMSNEEAKDENCKNVSKVDNKHQNDQINVSNYTNSSEVVQPESRESGKTENIVVGNSTEVVQPDVKESEKEENVVVVNSTEVVQPNTTTVTILAIEDVMNKETRIDNEGDKETRKDSHESQNEEVKGESNVLSNSTYTHEKINEHSIGFPSIVNPSIAIIPTDIDNSANQHKFIENEQKTEHKSDSAKIENKDDGAHRPIHRRHYRSKSNKLRSEKYRKMLKNKKRRRRIKKLKKLLKKLQNKHY